MSATQPARTEALSAYTNIVVLLNERKVKTKCGSYCSISLFSYAYHNYITLFINTPNTYLFIKQYINSLKDKNNSLQTHPNMQWETGLVYDPIR